MGAAQVLLWAEGLAEVGALIRHRFARSEPRKYAVDYVQGLLSGEERMSSWTLSERAGDRLPDRRQRLLSQWKKGPRPAGGRLENCQIMVFSSCATPAGRTLIDREMYLPVPGPMTGTGARGRAPAPCPA